MNALWPLKIYVYTYMRVYMCVCIKWSPKSILSNLISKEIPQVQRQIDLLITTCN